MATIPRFLKRMGEVKALGVGRFVITEGRYNERDQR
jgi:hypothetical protein